MSTMLVYPVLLLVLGGVAVLAARCARTARRATPPWEGAWPRGESYIAQQDRANRRTRAAVGGILGVAIAAPIMMLAGFAGAAKGPTRKR